MAGDAGGDAGWPLVGRRAVATYFRTMFTQSFLMHGLYLIFISCLVILAADRMIVTEDRGILIQDQTRQNTYGRAQGGDCSTLPFTTVSTYK